MAISEETFQYELQHAAKLHSKHRGELAELAFMRKAATLGFAVAKPWRESERYDFVVRSEKIFWRVQIKSVLRSPSARNHYRVNIVNSAYLPYTAEEIDFLVAYIFAEDTWYVFPVSVVENHTGLCIRRSIRSKSMGSKSRTSKFDRYREAWDLMRAGCTRHARPEQRIESTVERVADR